MSIHVGKREIIANKFSKKFLMNPPSSVYLLRVTVRRETEIGEPYREAQGQFI